MKRVMSLVMSALTVISAAAVEENYTFDYNGSTGIQCSPIPNYAATNMTVEAWIKPDVTGNSHTIVNWNNGGSNALFRITANKLQFGQWNGSSWQNVMSASTITTGVWTHVAIVRDNGSAQLYINGVADGGAVTITNNITPNRFDIGAQTTIEYFDGQIDEVRVWSKVLTVEELNTQRHLSVTGTTPDLVGYWKLNRTSGTVAYDYTGNAHNGSVNGTASWVPSTAPVIEYQSGNPGPPAIETDPFVTGTTVLFNAEWIQSAQPSSSGTTGLTVSSGSLTATDYAIQAQYDNSEGVTTADLTNLTELTIRASKVWNLKNNGSQSFDLVFGLDGQMTSADAADYALIRRDAISGDFVYHSGLFSSSQASSVDTVNSRVTFSNISLSDGFYSLGSVHDTLTPVLGFSAQLEGDQLSWQAEQELDIAFYEIQYLANGQWFTESTVNAGNGHYTYLLMDSSREYRILVVDHSGFSQSFGLKADERSVSVAIQAGWNLLAFPFALADAAAALQPENPGEVWIWDGQNYWSASETAPLQGFWYFANEAAQVTLRGPIASTTLETAPGWNLNGVPENQPVPAGQTIYSWGSTYESLLNSRGVLVPGAGYWWYVSH